ncbi:MAG: ThuA domain-containing protein, partial [Verrucomicrobiota bacterium]
KNYDGIIFANTTGDLPLPDKDAFLNWIKSGKAFIGMHSATDTFRGHTPLDPYVEMIGGEFKGHGAQVEVTCLNQDPKHPACKNFGPTFAVKDEIYILNGFDRAKVHGLLTLDKEPNTGAPGDYPIAWCKKYGKGNVFYTSLGHREDVWESESYQKHILGGIKWALGLENGDAKPQAK